MKPPFNAPESGAKSLVTADSFGMFVGGAMLVVFAVQFLALFG